MTVGRVANSDIIDVSLSNNARSLRDLATQILQLGVFVNKLGLSGLEGLGYSPTDAQSVLDMANHMTTVMQVYKGTATQGSLFNFEDFLTILWAGQ